MTCDNIWNRIRIRKEGETLRIKIILHIGNIPSYEIVSKNQPQDEFGKNLSLLNNLLLKALNSKSGFMGFLLELAPMEHLILWLARRAMQKNQINMNLQSLSVKKEGIGMLKLSVSLEQIDYLSLVKMVDLRKLSIKDEKVKKVIDTLLAMENMPDRLLEGVLNSMTQDEKDHLVVEIVNIYMTEIKEMLNQAIKNSCPVQINDMEIKNEEGNN